MSQDHVLRMALLISLSCHIIIISPWNLFNSTKKKKDIKIDTEVYYMPSKEVDNDTIEPLPQNYDLAKKERKLIKNKANADDLFDASEEGEKITSISEEESESLEEYVQYYELIREKIKKSVSTRHASSRKRGEVGISFELDSSGALKHLSHIPASSAADNALVDLALRSVEESSPFPAFPKALNKNSLTFNLTIVFKK